MTTKASVEMWFDPICPWAWLTSRWLMEVEQVRDVQVTWSVMSLAALNEGRDLSPDYRSLMDDSWSPVRVIAAATHDHGEHVVKALYDAIGTRIHLGGKDHLQAVVEALQEVGLPEDLIRFAHSQVFDQTVRASHDRAMALVGEEVGTPVIAMAGTAFFGPVVTPTPRGEAAGRLWDGWVLMSGTPGFFELKRTRTASPDFS